MWHPQGDVKIIQAIDRHIEEHIGKTAFVLDEKDSPYVHGDIHIVAATQERPYHILVTSAMSEKAIPVPRGASGGRFAELIICLPPHWPLTMEAGQNEGNWWPIRLLKEMARYPHEYKTWLYSGPSINSKNPPQPFAPNSRMTSLVLLQPRVISSDAQIVQVTDDKHVRLWGIYPLLEEEQELKVRDGSDKLEELFSKNGITELLDPSRPSVVPVQ